MAYAWYHLQGFHTLFLQIKMNLILIDITEHLCVEVKNTQNLEIVNIQHVMLSHTVLAQAMPPHSLFLNTEAVYLGYQYFYHKIYLKIELMVHFCM